MSTSYMTWIQMHFYPRHVHVTAREDTTGNRFSARSRGRRPIVPRSGRFPKAARGPLNRGSSSSSTTSSAAAAAAAAAAAYYLPIIIIIIISSNSNSNINNKSLDDDDPAF
jgi:hypothetical protein